MKKILVFALLSLFSLSNVEARSLFGRGDDTDTTNVNAEKKVEATTTATDKKTEEPVRRGIFSRFFGGEEEKKVEKVKEEKVIEKKDKDEKDSLIKGVGNSGNSPNLLRKTSEVANKSATQVGEEKKPTTFGNSKAELEDRAAKNRARFEKNNGMTIEEADRYYSDSIAKDKNKKIDVVKDELDK